jgi:Rap1a immunity proteins
MRRGIIVRASLALVLLTGPAWGADNYTSANYLMPACRVFAAGGTLSRDVIAAATGAFNGGRCLGIIEGTSAASTDICGIPNEVTTGQLVLVVIQYIDQRPQRMHEPLTILAYEALKAAWPCKPDQAGK